MSTAEATRKNIARMAVEAFAGHVAQQEGPGEWLCRNPKDSHRWFRVIIRPHRLIVWGDIGDWILSHGNPDGLGWLRRAAGNPEYPGYFLSKLRAGRDREFYEGDALAWLDEQVSAGYEDATEVKEALGDGFGQHEWFAAWHEHGTSIHDIPDCLDWGPGPLWLAQAMSWFVANVPTEPQDTSTTVKGDETP